METILIVLALVTVLGVVVSPVAILVYGRMKCGKRDE